jgi:hypothetical protein
VLELLEVQAIVHPSRNSRRCIRTIRLGGLSTAL